MNEACCLTWFGLPAPPVQEDGEVGWSDDAIAVEISRARPSPLRQEDVQVALVDLAVVVQVRRMRCHWRPAVARLVVRATLRVQSEELVPQVGHLASRRVAAVLLHRL